MCTCTKTPSPQHTQTYIHSRSTHPQHIHVCPYKLDKSLQEIFVVYTKLHAKTLHSDNSEVENFLNVQCMHIIHVHNYTVGRGF